MKLPDLPKYRWPDLSACRRQYIVRDESGRFGVAIADPVYHPGSLAARPIDMPAQMSAESLPGAETLPRDAVVITSTSWVKLPEGTYSGSWYDDDDARRTLTIVQDLGWMMPDIWAYQALAGSANTGHWDHGAIGKVGEPPVKEQANGEMSVNQAEEYAREVGEPVAKRTIRYAARNEFIPGARKVGRDWLIPYDGLNRYLDNRPKPGRKMTNAHD